MGGQFWGMIASVIVALIAAGAAYASSRAAAKASKLNASTTSRVDMEKEAYERARKFDVETIERQDKEILELREELEEVKTKNYNQEIQIRVLKVRVEHLEKGNKQ